MTVNDDVDYLIDSIAEFGTKALMRAFKDMYPDTFMDFLIEMQDITDEELRSE